MKKAKADAMAEFRASQPFFDTCSAYYGDWFDDYLKQVGSVYLDLDLSKIIIDDTVPQTLGRDDFINYKTDNSIHMVKQEVRDDEVVIVQPTPEGPDAHVVSSIVDPSSRDGLTTVKLTVSDAPLS